MTKRCEHQHGFKQCVLVEHVQAIEHCYVGPAGWIFDGAKEAQHERIKELSKELREANELIVAFITGHGDMIKIDEHDVRTYKLFLDDREIAQVSEDDMFYVSRDNERSRNVYEVVR